MNRPGLGRGAWLSLALSGLCLLASVALWRRLPPTPGQTFSVVALLLLCPAYMLLHLGAVTLAARKYAAHELLQRYPSGLRWYVLGVDLFMVCCHAAALALLWYVVLPLGQLVSFQ